MTVEEALVQTLASGEGRSVSPEAVARLAAGETWRRCLPEVRAVAVRLAREGRVIILRHGRPTDPERFKGVYRLGPPADNA